LRRISKNGRDEFYKGETATLVRYLQKKGAIITMEDLAQYEAGGHLLVLNTKT
jgi:gamma-glutamyltranspeptidase/glutathione hydrolase